MCYADPNCICSQLTLYSTSEFSCTAGWQGLGTITRLPPVTPIKRCPKRNLLCVVVMFYFVLLKMSKQNLGIHSKKSYLYEKCLEIKGAKQVE
jgi:hypothetical protein